LRGGNVVASHMAEDDDEEDEETLRLQLQAIEARLKLKKLKSKKARCGDGGQDGDTASLATPPQSRATSALSSRGVNTDTHILLRSRSTADIQIPLSPERRQRPVELPRSPGRVLLGIDKGKSGKHVSLRRAPHLLVPRADDTRDARSTMRSPRTAPPTSSDKGQFPGRSASKTFNERMAEVRGQEQKDLERKSRAESLRQQRTGGFSVSKEQIEQYHRAAAEKDDVRLQGHEGQAQEQGFSREQVMAGLHPSAASITRRTRNQNDHISSGFEDPFVRPSSKEASQRHLLTRSERRPQSRGAAPPTADPISTDGESTLEAFSSTQLSKRILPHTFVARTVEAKKCLLLPDLLREVKAPDFSLPDSYIDEYPDYVVFGIIASKSAPLDHKAPFKARTHDQSKVATSYDEADEASANANRKYMALTLVDGSLKWPVDLYLFATAYTRFRKLSPGTLVAILNPSIMPPIKGREATNRWSLRLGSGDDTVLEIGTARDLGWCKAVKRNGEACGSWIDRGKTEFCEFHVSRQVEKVRSGRMDCQGLGMGYGPGGSLSRRKFGGGGGGGGSRGHHGDDYDDKGGKENKKRDGKQYDKWSHSTYFIASGGGYGGQTAASLLDADERGGRDGGPEERRRRILAEKEREREMAKSLSTRGGGAGAEYMRVKHTGQALAGLDQRSAAAGASRGEAGREAPDAKQLGLLGGRASTVLLSPLKRKKSVRDEGAPRKKTRFVTEKGIREAGRDSLGTPGIHAQESDSDLDIV